MGEELRVRKGEAEGCRERFFSRWTLSWSTKAPGGLPALQDGITEVRFRAPPCGTVVCEQAENVRVRIPGADAVPRRQEGRTKPGGPRVLWQEEHYAQSRICLYQPV